MSTDNAKPEVSRLILPPPKNELAEFIVANIERSLVVLPAHVDRQHFAANAIAAVNELNPDDCMVKGKYTFNSVLYSVFSAARMGLAIGGPLQLCFLVPYAGVCTLIVGYRGYVTMALGNRWLRQVYADVVLRGEPFKMGATERGPRFRHDVPPETIDQRIGTRDNVMGAYCVYRSRSGFGFRFVSRAQINQVAKSDRTKSGKPTPWGTSFGEMCRKVPVARATKDWKLTPELALAVELDERVEREEFPTGDEEFGTAQPQRLSFHTSRTIVDEIAEANTAATEREPVPVRATAMTSAPQPEREPGEEG